MRISVIMPVYNTHPLFLDQAICSVFKQSYPPVELIIVNDGSNKLETLKRLLFLKESFPELIFINQENKGIPGALNAGIKNMKGDWFAGLSSDDRWFPNKLSEQVKYIKENPEAKVIYSDWEFIDKNGSKIKTYNEPEFKSRQEAGYHLIREHFPNWSGMVIHKSVFDKIGLYNEEFITREDYEMSVRILTRFMMYKIPKILFQYRLHPEQLSSSNELNTRTDESRRLCEKARDLAIEYFGNEEDRKEFPLGREYRWRK